MTFNKSLKLFLPMVLLSAAANASVVFNFDGDSPGTSTIFTSTVSNLSATFSSSADPGGFVVYPSIFETLTGNVLGDPGPAFMDNLALDISFSQDLSAIELDFATSDFLSPSLFTVSAYQNSDLVGSVSSTGQFLPGFTFPEGEIAFEGAAFNNVVISSGATDFAVDNIAAVTAPEPGALASLGIGLFLLGVSSMRRRKPASK
jgi:hypothetical protein